MCGILVITRPSLFTTPVITYELSPELFLDDDFSPVLYLYNEEEQNLKKVDEQYIDGNKIVATLNHFSKYIVIDEKEYSRIDECEVEYIDPALIESQGTDYFVVIYGDEEYAYSPYNHFEKEKLFVDNFIDSLESSDRVSVLICNENGYTMSPISNSKKYLHDLVETIEIEQEITASESKNIVFDYIKSDEYNKDARTKKVVLFVAPSIDSTNYDQLVSEVNETKTLFLYLNISFYDDYSGQETYSIHHIWPEYGAQQVITTCKDPYYKATAVRGDVEWYFSQLSLYKDVDKDGLCDYYEEKMISGELTTMLGVRFNKIKKNIADSDGDGLTDGKEVKIISIDGRAYVYMYSDPTRHDTDEDGVGDLEDPWPLEKHDFSILSDVLVKRNNESYLDDVLPVAKKWDACVIARDPYYTPISVELNEYYDTIALRHTTRNKYENINNLENNEVKDGFNGMPYHFVISGSGVIYEGKPLDVLSEAIYKNNSNKISISLMGNFQSDEKTIKQYLKNAMPSEPGMVQVHSLVKLLQVLKTQYGIDIIGGHCDFTEGFGYETKCPGDILYMQIKDMGWINAN